MHVFNFLFIYLLSAGSVSLFFVANIDLILNMF